MPAIFFGHGSPMNVIEDNRFTQKWETLANEFPRPNAIVSISAHWETSGTFVTATENPQTIHDFGGFPNELYDAKYPAPGNPKLAEIIIDSVTSTKINKDLKWGLDHGTWSILSKMYPKADIPVLQLSIDYTKPFEFHYKLGKELKFLRENGILLIGSGNIVHNLRLLNWQMPNAGYDWAIEANDNVKSFVINNDVNSLIGNGLTGKDIKLAIPTPEHYIPLLYILATKSENEQIEFFNDEPVYGSLTMTSFIIK